MEQDYPEYRTGEWSYNTKCAKCANKKKDGFDLCQRCMDVRDFGYVFTAIDQLNNDITEKNKQISDRNKLLVQLKTRKLELEKELEIKKEEIQTRIENITKVTAIISKETSALRELNRQLLESHQSIKLHKDLVSNDIRVYTSEDGTGRLETHCTIVRPSESQEDLYFGHVTLKLTTDKDYIWHYGIEMYDKLPRKLEHSFWYDVEKVNSPEILYINDYGFKFPQGTTLSDIMKKHFEDCFKAFDRSQWTQIWSRDEMMTDGTKDVDATVRLNRLKSQFEIRSAIKQSEVTLKERERKRNEQKDQEREQDEQEKANRMKEVARETIKKQQKAIPIEVSRETIKKQEKDPVIEAQKLAAERQKAAEQSVKEALKKQQAAEQSVKDKAAEALKKQQAAEQSAKEKAAEALKKQQAKEKAAEPSASTSTSKKQKAEELRKKQEEEDALFAEAAEAAETDRLAGVKPPQEQKSKKKQTVADLKAVKLCEIILQESTAKILELVEIEKSLVTIDVIPDLSRERRNLIKRCKEYINLLDENLEVVKTYKVCEQYLSILIQIKKDAETLKNNLLQIEQNYIKEYYQVQAHYFDESNDLIIENIMLLKEELTYNDVKTLVEKTRTKNVNSLLSTKNIIDLILSDNILKSIYPDMIKMAHSFNSINSRESREDVMFQLNKYLTVVLFGHRKQIENSTLTHEDKETVYRALKKVAEEVNLRLDILVEQESTST